MASQLGVLRLWFTHWAAKFKMFCVIGSDWSYKEVFDESVMSKGYIDGSFNNSCYGWVVNGDGFTRMA